MGTEYYCPTTTFQDTYCSIILLLLYTFSFFILLILYVHYANRDGIFSTAGPQSRVLHPRFCISYLVRFYVLLHMYVHGVLCAPLMYPFRNFVPYNILL